MSSNFPRDSRRQTGGSQPQQQWGSGYGQPASDSERLRQFADAYEEQVRHLPTLRAREVEEGVDLRRSRGGDTWGPLVAGLVVFVLLLAVAMAMGLLLIHP